ncbi:hypothetical protein Taro_036216 [Colocasia esculenta]|uniref:MBD domain-containing protein n=1 Tax=Colocasia esculenta TaxID=4460 RepID=A0A843WH64_COLES|nr:hypothetical protein [Colocasia esculenta]
MEDGEGRSPKAPDWLPDGWTMKIRTRKDGKMDRYYISPVSGYTFRSRVEVMRYLNVEKGDEGLPVTTACPEEGKPCVTECSEEDKPCDVAQVKNSPKWLPSGWTVEFRSCQSDTTARKKKKVLHTDVSISKYLGKVGPFLHYAACPTITGWIMSCFFHFQES